MNPANVRFFAQAAQQPDPVRRLEIAAHATRRQWQTSAAMIAVYQSAAAADTEAAAELAEALGSRRTNLTRFITGMASMLRPDLDAGRATDIFLALTRAEVYQELVDTAGWSPDEYERWLADLLKQQLLL